MTTEPAAQPAAETADVVLRDLRPDGVLVLTLNRPDRANAWNMELEEGYFAALTDAAADPAVKVIVVTGAGKAFCPGMDSQVLSTSVNQGQHPNRFRRPMVLAAKVPKPVIVAINGACAGIGLIQALAADVRFANRGAKLTTAFARRGLLAENGISWMITRLVGTGVAMDLLLSGRVVDADEAKALGLVNFVSEPGKVLDDAIAYAGDMAANCSPNAMARIKAQVYADYERAFDEARTDALAGLADFKRHPDFKEGVNSFVEKRAPQFAGLSFVVTDHRDELPE
jgi:enoyl-CoA hydratase/carnithine racemase